MWLFVLKKSLLLSVFVEVSRESVLVLRIPVVSSIHNLNLFDSRRKTDCRLVLSPPAWIREG